MAADREAGDATLITGDSQLSSMQFHLLTKGPSSVQLQDAFSLKRVPLVMTLPLDTDKFFSLDTYWKAQVGVV